MSSPLHGEDLIVVIQLLSWRRTVGNCSFECLRILINTWWNIMLLILVFSIKNKWLLNGRNICGQRFEDVAFFWWLASSGKEGQCDCWSVVCIWHNLVHRNRVELHVLPLHPFLCSVRCMATGCIYSWEARCGRNGWRNRVLGMDSAQKEFSKPAWEAFHLARNSTKVGINFENSTHLVRVLGCGITFRLVDQCLGQETRLSLLNAQWLSWTRVECHIWVSLK